MSKRLIQLKWTNSIFSFSCLSMNQYTIMWNNNECTRWVNFFSDMYFILSKNCLVQTFRLNCWKIFNKMNYSVKTQSYKKSNSWIKIFLNSKRMCHWKNKKCNILYNKPLSKLQIYQRFEITLILLYVRAKISFGTNCNYFMTT